MPKQASYDLYTVYQELTDQRGWTKVGAGESYSKKKAIDKAQQIARTSHMRNHGLRTKVTKAMVTSIPNGWGTTTGPEVVVGIYQ